MENKSHWKKCEVIAPEFPLKKDNNQSTNIDFLLVNNSRNSLTLVEIKTDTQSFDHEQLEIYSRVKEKIKLQSAEILRSDLNNIKKGSNRPEKYDYIISRFDECVSSAHRIWQIDLIYLVPKALASQIGANGVIDRIICFEDLPATIIHRYAEYWSIIRSKLLLLDEYFKPTYHHIANGDPMKVIVKNIKQYLSASGQSFDPDYIQVGITGDGNTPNYQVTFKNGFKKAFHYSGKEHRITVFQEKNLGPRRNWVEING